MKVLHIYPKSDELIQRHVALLAEGMRQSADVRFTDSNAAFRTIFQEQQPDIVHCHGCWHYSLARAAQTARRRGARVVLTLHGQLEPWVTSEKPIQDKFGKTLLWQKAYLEQAYAVITLGKLERSNFLELGWNRRVEEIHNAVTTNTITTAEMCSKTFAIYQKVIDSNTLEALDERNLEALSTIIKAGITGDKRWCSSLDALQYPQNLDWRRLLVYAEHEHIRNYVDYGISILGLSTPAIDTDRIGAYFPDNYIKPQSLKDVIGDYEGNETDYLLRMIRQLQKQPLLLHMIELTRELMRDTVNDELLAEALDNKKLTNFTRSLIQVLSEQTGLDEGYMPLPPADNRLTGRIRKQLANHLKI